MSNRKENVKRTLGITEYPWSSDDEETEGAAVQDVQVIRRQRNEAEITPPLPHVPGTSSQPSTSASSQNAARRNHLFWSLSSLGNPHRLPSGGLPRSRIDVPLSLGPRQMDRGGTERPRPTSASDARLASDVQRILAFRKLNRNTNNYRSCRANLYTLHRIFRSRRDEISAFIKAGRERIYQRPLPDHPPGNAPTLNQAVAGEPQASTSGHSRRTIPPSVVSLENIEPVNLEPSDDDVDLLQTSMSAPAATNITEVTLEPDGTTEAGGSHNVSGVSLEEEIVEIDAEPEAAAEVGAAPGDDPRPSEEPGPSEEPVTANTNGTSDEQHPSPHGVKRKRESTDDNSEPPSVREFNQNLLRLLECPVCLEWMEPPMSQCRRGHLVCTRCRARLAACPVCRTAFSSVRNRAMESVAELLRYPCRHGCARDLRLRRRAAHESSCAARRYRCPAPVCADRAPLPHAELAHHLQGKHPAMVKYGRKHKFSLRVNSEQHDNWVVMALHELFHLRVDVDVRTWGMVVYVAYIGPKCNADNYIYEVAINGQQNSRRLIYSRATHCDLECSSENVSRQDCFHLTLDQAINFLRIKNRHCEADKILNFTVEVSKCENEAREDSDS